MRSGSVAAMNASVVIVKTRKCRVEIGHALALSRIVGRSASGPDNRHGRTGTIGIDTRQLPTTRQGPHHQRVVTQGPLAERQLVDAEGVKTLWGRYRGVGTIDAVLFPVLPTAGDGARRDGEAAAEGTIIAKVLRVSVVHVKRKSPA